MTFSHKKLFAGLVFCYIVTAYCDSKFDHGETAFLRPILLRSEFVSSGTLRGLQRYSTMPEYDVFGFPKFKHVYIRHNLHFWETKLAQTRSYARYLNRLYKQDILAHPELYHPDTIAAYKKGLTSINPRSVDGTELQWHHGRDGYELVPVSEHGKVPHTGGAKTYGYKYAEASAKIPNREIILTAQRWGQFVALDLAFSTLGMALGGERDFSDYVVNAGASATAGFVAWGMESLLITAFPLLQGGTPIFLGSCMINLGGPASWLATGVFFATKYLITTGWKEYQLRQALETEKECRKGEAAMRVRILKQCAARNTQQLQEISRGLEL